jgi:methionine-rich copper-binding protein CopC
MVPLSETLAPGAYTVEWHALSADGHKTNGAFTFTVKP